MRGETRFSDYVSFLQDLDRTQKPYFLEGGQAVNFWAEYCSARDGGELQKFQPFTSDDCDIWIGRAAQEYLEQKQSGSLVKGTSPADGQLGVIKLGGNPPRKIDLLTNVFGIPPNQYERLVQRSLTVNDVTVIDPLNLFLSKCHCLLELDQTSRQDEKHLRMLCLILPSYLSGLIEEIKGGGTTERDFIKDIKRLRKICQTNKCRRALLQIEVPAQSLIPVLEMLKCELPLLEQFAKTQLQESA